MLLRQQSDTRSGHAADPSCGGGEETSRSTPGGCGRGTEELRPGRGGLAPRHTPRDNSGLPLFPRAPGELTAALCARPILTFRGTAATWPVGPPLPRLPLLTGPTTLFGEHRRFTTALPAPQHESCVPAPTALSGKSRGSRAQEAEALSPSQRLLACDPGWRLHRSEPQLPGQENRAAMASQSRRAGAETLVPSTHPCFLSGSWPVC